MIDIKKILLDETELRSARSKEEMDWKELNTFLRPRSTNEISGLDAEGNLDTPIYTSSPYFAAESFGSGIYAAMHNPQTNWFSCTIDDDDANNQKDVKMWLARASKVVFKSLQSSVSSFYTEVINLDMGWGIVGNAVFHSQIIENEQRFIDRSISPFDCVWDIDHYGQADTIYRQFRRTVKMAIAEFGEENIHEKMMAKKDSKDKFTFIQVVMRNPERDKKAIGHKNKKYLSIIIDKTNKHEVHRSGFRYKPLYIVRMNVPEEGKTGVGLGARALPDVRLLNIQERDMLAANEKALNPPVLVTDEEVEADLQNYAGGVTLGGLVRGTPAAKLLEPTTNSMVLTRDQMNDKREQIEKHFIFSTASYGGRTGVSDAENYNEQQKSLMRVFPHLTQYIGEFLTPFLKNRLLALEEAGQLPERPEALKEKDIEISYNTPAINAQKAEVVRGIMGGINQHAQLEQFFPGMLDHIDFDGVSRHIVKGNNIPPELMNSMDTVNKKRESRAQQQQQSQMMANAGTAADIANKAGIDVGEMLNGGDNE